MQRRESPDFRSPEAGAEVGISGPLYIKIGMNYKRTANEYAAELRIY